MIGATASETQGRCKQDETAGPFSGQAQTAKFEGGDVFNELASTSVPGRKSHQVPHGQVARSGTIALGVLAALLDLDRYRALGFLARPMIHAPD